MIQQKKSQAFGMDLIVAASIFFVGIIIFYVYAINYGNDDEEDLSSLSYDADIIASSLLSSGYPTDWNSSNVVQIGILSNNKINETKLQRFYEFSLNEYNRTRSIFNTQYDYYFFMDEDMNIGGIAVDGIGKQGTDKDNIPAQNLVKKIRYTIYKDKPQTVYLYLWGD